MEKEIRARIQRATQEGRQLLEREFTEQLGGVYDIEMNGTVATAAGFHLADDAQAQRVRIKLVAAVAHHRAQGLSGADAVAALRRECAFTTFNRFVALKMLEAREIVLECVSRGTESRGFREFVGLAPGLAGSPESAWRLYLECVFDEIGREVRVLFDRRDPASLLWPRRAALDALLAVLNAPELGAVWGEDETIGWVYQYFNGDDERKQMRAESQAPRNSRELAVRNQFFTPRYVVEFLTDNTLGQTWVEMCRGVTQLAKDCRYLLRPPGTIYLAKGETARGREEAARFGQNPAYVPFREMKDPRDIKVLDPASGSGHFLLYSFDLLIRIYDEAWEAPAAVASLVTGRGLRADYPTKAALHLAVPGLILRHNLFGIDIDPRAAQIAALALWMRAQRAWNHFQVGRPARALVTRTNVVVAEPMPGERDLLAEFCRGLEPQVGALVQQVFDAMALAGEAGTLLRIQDTLRQGLAERAGQGLLFTKHNELRWREIEHKVYAALREYAEAVSGGTGYRRRLFADDAARGFAFIEACWNRYDVVLMNPPFGEWSSGLAGLAERYFETARSDIGAAFVLEGAALAGPSGRVGALTNRTFLSTSLLSKWRRAALLGPHQIERLADLGYGVLDGAMVEAAAFVVSNKPVERLFSASLLNSRNKDADLLSAVGSFSRGGEVSLINETVVADFAALPLSLIAHWAPREVVARFLRSPRLTDLAGGVNDGGHTGNDPRFLRLAWEVNPGDIGRGRRFPLFAKGGEYSPFWDDVYLVVNWDRDGHEVRAISGARIYHEDLHFTAGLTYPLRTTSDWSPRLLPSDTLFSTGGHGIHFASTADATVFLGFAYTRLMKLCVEVLMGGGDASVAGSAARNYTAGTMAFLPDVQAGEHLVWQQRAAGCVRLVQLSFFEHDETTRLFFCPRVLSPLRAAGAVASLNTLCVMAWRSYLGGLDALSESAESFERHSNAALGIPNSPALHRALSDMFAAHPADLADVPPDPDTLKELLSLNTSELSQRLVELTGANRAVTKKSYFVERDLELISRLTGSSLSRVIRASKDAVPPSSFQHSCAADLISWAVGVSFGRFDLEHGRPARAETTTDTLFAALPPCSPGMLTGGDGLPVAAIPPGYPCQFPTDGILLDDPGHDRDLARRIANVFEALFGDSARERLGEAADILDPGSVDLRSWIRRSFFADHVQRYSKSRRNAPIYWRLGVPSGSYSVWIYMHRVDKDTLHRVLNDHLLPKVAFEEGRLLAMTIEGAAPSAGATRPEIFAQEALVDELRGLRDEIQRVAPLWDPDLRDGVNINAAPLYRLFGHSKGWQRECEAEWELLNTGEYDWAHLAMRLWPERVLAKCAADRSIAIAHQLEDAFWQLTADGKWSPRLVSAAELAIMVSVRTLPAAKAALQSLERAGSTAASARSVRTKRPSAGPREPRPGPPRRTPLSAPSVAPDGPVLDTLRAAFHQFPDPASRADLLAASGLDEASWKPAIDALVARGEVERTGQARGTRYTLVIRPALSTEPR